MAKQADINRNNESPGDSAAAGRRAAPILAWPLIVCVRLYQVTLGPLMGGHCRFQPTCSQYAIDALREYGAIRGSWLAMRRLLRCHPFGGIGYDPVPKRDDQKADQQNPQQTDIEAAHQ